MKPTWPTILKRDSAWACAVLWLACAAPSLGATPSPFDPPLKIVRAPLPRDADNPRSRPKVSCFYFPRFMVKQVDLGEEGAAQLSILPGAPATACRQANAPGERVISPDDWTGYFDGVRGDYAVFTAEDGWNGGMGFAVFDARTGRKVFDDAAKARFRSVQASSDGLVLRYRRVFTPKCSLIVDRAGCWRAIRRQTGLAGDRPPDCSAAYDREARRTPKFAAQLRDDPTVIDYEALATLRNSHATIRTAPGDLATCHPAD
jgi:hypothetical protein